MDDPPKRIFSSASVRDVSSCKLLAAMAEGDFARDVNPSLRRDDVVDGANASVVDRLDDATSASNALTARREGTISVEAMKMMGSSDRERYAINWLGQRSWLGQVGINKMPPEYSWFASLCSEIFLCLGMMTDDDVR